MFMSGLISTTFRPVLFCERPDTALGKARGERQRRTMEAREDRRCEDQQITGGCESGGIDAQQWCGHGLFLQSGLAAVHEEETDACVLYGD
jgi:hypothetical protein